MNLTVKFENIALILLAAGHGRRFGGQKLSASLAGRPLAQHAAATFAALPFARHIAVVAQDDLRLSEFGFQILPIDQADQPMSQSIIAGVRVAQRDEKISAVMIALADMPFVSADHVRALVRNFGGAIIASHNGEKPMPPAIFGRRHFARLLELGGDNGARDLINDAPCVAASQHILADIDTIEQLAEAETTSN